MKTLFIDTHLYDINVILFEDNVILNETHIVGEKHNSKFLLPSIKQVCDNHEYDQIVVVNGPGSFTGVRLGVTVAKTLAYTQNIPIKSVTSLDLMNYSSDASKHVFAINDGNGYFIGEYENHQKIKDFYYLSNVEYKQFINNNTVETNVAINYEEVLNSIKKFSLVNPHSVNPIYIKLIGVESGKKN